LTAFGNYLLTALLCVAAGGCAITNDFRAPSIAVPERWSPAQTNDVPVAQSAIAWWTMFHDIELNSLIERAVQANLDVRIARTRLLEVRKQLRITSANNAPSLNAVASYAREKESMNAPAPVLSAQDGTIETPGQSENLFQTGLDAKWELDIFGGQRRTIDEARALVEVAAFEPDAVILSLLAEVSRTYIELRTTQRQFALASQEMQVRTDMAELVRARYAGGMAPYGELTHASLLARQAAANIAPLESRYKGALNRLGTLLGQWPGALAPELQAPTPIPVGSLDVAAGLPSDLLRQRPDILRAERRMAVSSARVGVATADLYPQLSLNGSAGLASVSARDFFSPGSVLWKVGPTLTWPILRRGQIVATIEVRNLQQQEALIEYRRTILSALEEADNAIDVHAQQIKRRAALAAAAGESDASVSMARSRYAGGMADFREVLDAKIVQLQAQGELASSDGDVALSLVALYKAVGGGWNAASIAAHADRFDSFVNCDVGTAGGKRECFSSP